MNASWLETNISATNRPTAAASSAALTAATAAKRRRRPPRRRTISRSVASTVSQPSGATMANVTHAAWPP